jgi:hypothetical protein
MARWRGSTWGIRTFPRRTRRRSETSSKSALEPILELPSTLRSTGVGSERQRWFATPWEILRQVPDVASHLKVELTIAQLGQQAEAKSDTRAAEEMQEAKCKLFGGFQGRSLSQAAASLLMVARRNRAPMLKNQNTL